ncbi:MAG: N-acetylmuramoyl-L-alanine amidase [Pseudomonadota bacterium]
MSSLSRTAVRWLIAALLLAAASFAHALVAIDGVRAYRAPEYTRFVFDVSATPQYQVLPDVAPGRVVIDFRGAELKAKLESVDLQGSPVQRVRSGLQADGTIRVVFDLSVAVRVNSFALQPNEQYGHRLVIDLYDIAVEQKAKTVEDFVDRSTGPRKIVVAIDAGHGGEDPGARGPQGTREKDVVLAIARAVRDLMKDDPGMQPVLIRDGDYYVGLKERRTLARRRHNADLFVSIHADAFTRRSARGASVFAVSRRGATSNTAAYLAEAENRADQVGGIDPQADNDVVSVISDLIMEGTMSHSLHLGRSVLDELGGFARLHKGSVEQAGFMVLKEPNMPSILVETGFISNPEEERLLRSPAYQQKLAKAVVGGVRSYFSRYPPPGTWFAAHRDGNRTSAKPLAAVTAPATAPAAAAVRVPDSPLADPAVDKAVAELAGRPSADPAAMPAVLVAPSAARPAATTVKTVRKGEPSKPSARRESAYILHKVGRGQSLGFLAQKYGVSQRAIREANNLRRTDLYIGETLKIPRR